MAFDAKVAVSSTLSRRNGSAASVDANSCVGVSRPILQMARCATAREWKSLTRAERIKWVEFNIECRPGEAEGYVDIIDGLIGTKNAQVSM